MPDVAVRDLSDRAYICPLRCSAPRVTEHVHPRHRRCDQMVPPGNLPIGSPCFLAPGLCGLPMPLIGPGSPRASLFSAQFAVFSRMSERFSPSITLQVGFRLDSGGETGLWRRDSIGAFLRQLDSLLVFGTDADLTDGQLLERFATREGTEAEQAFATLVERHGPMVLRVCRGVLANSHDTEDAFQATFLVLVKKAASG